MKSWETKITEREEGEAIRLNRALQTLEAQFETAMKELEVLAPLSLQFMAGGPE